MPTQSTNNNTEAKLPTGDIKVFIDAFNKDFDKKLKSLLEIQQNYKNVYADAIKITTPKVGPWPNDPKVVTIGDLFKYTFPDIESDKIVKPPDPTQYSYTDSAGWSKDLKYNKDEKIKTMYDTISRGIRSNKDINAYKALKPGITNPSLWSPGQYYFDVFMTEMLSPYGPLKKPTDANGGANAFGADVISGYSFAKTHGGSVSISFFDPSGEVELSKHRDPVDPKLDYYEFYDVLDSGYSGSGIRYIMSDITGIDINLGDSDTTAPKSFASLQTQYRSGVLSDLLQDPKFNKERGVIEDSASGSPSTFIGYYEHILLYKAFVQAGDNYKAVVLPLRNPEPEQQAKEPEKVLAKTIEPTAIGEVQFKFNVEKTDTFIVVGGTVSPPPEFIIVPNDGTKYIMDVFNDSDDLGDEYKEDNFAGSEEELFIASFPVEMVELRNSILTQENNTEVTTNTTTNTTTNKPKTTKTTSTNRCANFDETSINGVGRAVVPPSWRGKNLCREYKKTEIAKEDRKALGQKLTKLVGVNAAKSAMASIQNEQGFRGFNWNLGGVDLTDGRWSYDPTYMDGYILLPEGGTETFKSFVTFKDLDSFLAFQKNKYVTKGFDKVTNANDFAETYYKGWLGGDDAVRTLWKQQIKAYGSIDKAPYLNGSKGARRVTSWEDLRLRYKTAFKENYESILKYF
jgi:hypothetical protein